jgi:AsmA protein
MRFLFFLALGLVGAVGLLLVMLPYVVALDRVKGPIIARAEAVLQRQVEVGAVRLQIFGGLRFDLDDLAVYNPPGWQHPHLIKAGTLSVKVALRPLLRRQLQVTTVQLRDGEIRLERDPQGRMNISDLIDSSPAAATASPAPSGGAPGGDEATPSDHPLAGLLVSDLVLRNMDVTVVDHRNAPGQAITTTVSHVQLKLSDIAPGRAMPLDMAATLLTDRRENIRLQGTIGPIPPSLAAGQVPIDARLQVTDVLLDRLTPYLGAAFPLVQGRLGTDLKIQGRLDRNLHLTGSLSLAQAVVRQADVQGTASALPALQSTYDVNVDLAGERAELTDIRLTLASLQATLTGAIERLMSGPQVDLQFSTNAFAPGDLLGSIPLPEAFVPAPVGLHGTVQLQGAVKGTPDDLRADARADLRDVSLRSGSLDGGAQEVGGLLLETDRGQATLTLHLATPQPPSIGMDVRLRRAALERHAPAAAGKKPSHPQTAPSGPIRQVPPPKALLPPVTVHGKLYVDEGRLQHAKAQRLATEFSLVKGQLTSTQQMQLYAGSYQGTARVDLTQPEPSFSLDAKVADLDVGQVLDELTSARRTLRGLLSTDLHATGRGWAWEGISQTLDGHGRAKIVEARLMTLDLLPELLRVVQQLGERAGLTIDTTLARDPFKTIEGNWRLHRGRIATDRLRLRGAEVEAVLDGSVGLDRSLDYAGKVLLPSKFINLRGRPAFLPKDDQGRLTLPFIVKGTLMAPRVAVDEKALVGVVGGELIDKARKRLEGRLEGLLGAPPADEPPQEPGKGNPEAGERPKRPLRRLLEEFLKR